MNEEKKRKGNECNECYQIMDFPLPPSMLFVMGKVHVGLEKDSVHDRSILLSPIN